MLSIIIPAYNEETVIAQCLDSLLVQTFIGKLEIIVAANGCTDKTVEVVNQFDLRMSAKNCQLVVVEIAEGNKSHALNVADEIAQNPSRMYLDADVICDQALVAQIITLLEVETPCYASGTLEIQKGSSYATQAYAKIWKETPFVRDTVPGCGCYAVNEVGRKLWDKFPLIISDDKFVRLLFSETQRKKAQAKYHWPLPQGLFTLIKIRTRWILGNRQFRALYPDLLINDTKRISLDSSFLKTTFTNPVAAVIFLFITLVTAVRAYSKSLNLPIEWIRAR